MTKEQLLDNLRSGATLTRRDQVWLVTLLSIPACLGQLSTIVMQYIDAMMVGQLGAEASAAIGLVSTTTWLFGGLCHSLISGFCVLVAHNVGAKDDKRARSVLTQSIMLALVFSACISAFCWGIHNELPVWLGGRPEVNALASQYFGIWALYLPIMQMLFLSMGMLRSTGDMKMPMTAGVLMCVLDVIFNLLFIPRWGVAGAALATGAAGLVTLIVTLSYLLTRNEHLALFGRIPRLRSEHGESTKIRLRPRWDTFGKGLKIGTPMALEHILFCLALIASTLIVAPLGTVAIAANAFGIIVESLCYMPGYGIGDAATTLIGQSTGAKRPSLVHSFSWLTTGMGMGVMSALGVLMFVLAPEIMSIMTPNHAVQQLSTQVLRIEAFAEPMYAASIVIYGVFMGRGKTLMPCIMDLVSIWCVRIPLAWYLAQHYGLIGVWIAMATELTFRGAIFLIKLAWNK